MLAAIAAALTLAFSPLLISIPPEAGLKVEVYTYNEGTLPDRQPYTLCETGWTTAADMNFDVGGDVVANCAGDFVLIHYSGWITSPTDKLVTFSSQADDGFYLTIGGQPVIDNWTLKGCSGGSGIYPMIAGLSYQLDAWFYEYGGGACNRLWWDANGYDEIVPPSAFTRAPTEPIIEQPSLNSPRILNWVLTGKQLELAWEDLPTKTPIERWAVSFSYGDQSYAIATTEQKATLEQLPWDTDVTIRVRADNDSLSVYSDWSEPFTFHTELEPIVIPPTDPPVVDPPVVDPPVVDPPIVVPPVPDPQPSPEPTTEPTTAPTPEPEISSGISATEAHQQIMNQLWTAAQADDIEVPAAIADVPLIGDAAVAVISAINFLGNVGSDLTPQVRAKAKKTLISAVIVTQVAQFSTQTALASAAAAAGAPTSTLRKRVKE